MDNFQQTVDLREKMEKQRKPAPLEEIYLGEAGAPPENNLKTFSRPESKEAPQGLIRLTVLVLAVLAVGATVYFLFGRAKGQPAADFKAENWYAVKLVDGEIFYGQVADVKADPVVIDNVYYNYDQAKQAAAGDKDLSKRVEETGNIRLVKRGQETHGPAGSMSLVRAQVLFMEPLKTESKVLKAILEYEK